MAKSEYDFSGWATRTNMLCSDGRTIRRGAFSGQDGARVPLVWNHNYTSADNVLGHADLVERDDGMYAYCTFNDSIEADSARERVRHGDITNLSIYANHLKQVGGDVIGGKIREVSLVLAGANPGAFIDDVSFAHSDGDINEDDFEATIYTDKDISLYHSDDKKKKPVEEDSDEEEKDEDEEKSDDSKKKSEDESDKKEEEDMTDEEKKKLQHADDDGGETVEEVFNTLNEKQKNAVYAIIGAALEGEDGEAEHSDNDEEGEFMKHNVFDTEMEEEGMTLSHADMQTILEDGKRMGSLKDSFLAHADDYGIKDIDWLFPEARNLNTPPDWIKRETDWVQGVLNGVHKTPFSRIKSMFADIREDEARARGYIKGKRKKEEVFSLLKRTTDPQTIYKKQKLDRDDIIDITDFDVVAWIKAEMRMMLNEEIARAILVGDGRLVSDDDKIQEQHVRSILNDDELYSIKKNAEFTQAEQDDPDYDSIKAKKLINLIIKSRKDYKGSGNPTLYTTEDFVTDCLLLEDGIGHKIYKTEEELRTALRVSKIVTVPVLEGVKREKDGVEHSLIGIIVNLTDYNVGADKGGAVSMFDDFDIDYNQYKYLIETRISGALIKPFSALVIEMTEAAG